MRRMAEQKCCVTSHTALSSAIVVLDMVVFAFNLTSCFVATGLYFNMGLLHCTSHSRCSPLLWVLMASTFIQTFVFSSFKSVPDRVLDAHGECLRRFIICVCYVLIISTLGVLGELMERKTCFSTRQYIVVGISLMLTEIRLCCQFIAWVIYITNKEQSALEMQTINEQHDSVDYGSVYRENHVPGRRTGWIQSHTYRGGVSASRIKKIPQRMLNKGDMLLSTHSSSSEDSDDSEDIAYNRPICGICLSTYAVGHVVKTLECKHTFHSNELTEWLKIANTCPTCRTLVK